MKKTRSTNRLLAARSKGLHRSRGNLVGVYDYWCLLAPGNDFPTECMTDGMACNMHGGTLRIFEKDCSNGERGYCVQGQRLWKTYMEQGEDIGKAVGRKEELHEAMYWDSHRISFPEEGACCYDYTVSVLSSPHSPIEVTIVGTSRLRVTDWHGNRPIILSGEFGYRQEGTSNTSPGAAIFRKRIASRWTDMKGTIELRRKAD